MSDNCCERDFCKALIWKYGSDERIILFHLFNLNYKIQHDKKNLVERKC